MCEGRSGPEDTGNHTVAATMTQDFLDFTAGRGNNLKDVGIKPGMRWCLCAHRWQEAMQAAQDGQISQETVPKVYLHASGKAALDTVSYKDLKKYAVQEAGESRRQGGEHRPEGILGVARESQEIGGDMPTEAPGAGRWQGTGRKGEIVEVQSSRG